MDDTSIPLRNLSVIPVILDTVAKYGKITGSKLNMTKIIIVIEKTLEYIMESNAFTVARKYWGSI